MTNPFEKELRNTDLRPKDSAKPLEIAEQEATTKAVSMFPNDPRAQELTTRTILFNQGYGDMYRLTSDEEEEHSRNLRTLSSSN